MESHNKNCDAKSRLNLWCQKENIEYPVFESSIMGTLHNPIFNCSVVFLGEVFTGEGRTKKLSEKDASSKILEKVDLLIKNKELSSGREISSSYYLQPVKDNDFTTEGWDEISGELYFIDADGCTISRDSVSESEKTFFIFSNKFNGDRLSEIFSGNRNCRIIIADTLTKDATDHLMTFYISSFYHYRKERNTLHNIEFNIISKDHFSEYIAKLVNGRHLMKIE